MIELKAIVEEDDDSKGTEQDFNGDDTGFEYRPVKRTKKRKDKNEDDDCKVIREKDLKKKGITFKFDSGEQEEADRVLRTSFHLSKYAINLISMIKSSHCCSSSNTRISSRPKVMLDITSSTIDLFLDIMDDRFRSITKINQLACEINANSGKVSIIQPKLKINMELNDEYERVDSLILSSTTTKIRMLSEEFGVSNSCIVEYLVCFYVCNSDNIVFIKSKKHCESRMKAFIDQLDSFIAESTNIDENVLVNIGYKLALKGVIESTRVNNNFKDLNVIRDSISLDFDDFNISNKITLRKGKNNKRTYDESHSKGIFNKKKKRKDEKT